MGRHVLMSTFSRASSIKRDIGHLCHDETPGKGHGHAHHAMPKKSKVGEANGGDGGGGSKTSHGGDVTNGSGNANANGNGNEIAARSSAPASASTSVPPPATPSSTAGLGGAGFLGLGGSHPDTPHYHGGLATGGGRSDAAGGHEYNLLSEFLESLDGPLGVLDASAAFGAQPAQGQMQQGQAPTQTSSSPWATATGTNDQATMELQSDPSQQAFNANTIDATTAAAASATPRKRSRPSSPMSLSGFSTKKEKFFLTAADQVDGPRDERLSKVIQAKYDAGLLRPYNHVKGYARLNSWMESNVSAASRRRILKPLSVFRPRFRAVASSLSDIDLIYIEEAFERLLLDYDRVFSTQGIPACLWRRTGEIYKGNREFAELVGVGIEELREGRVAIYEFMQEESACNYWEKYGAVSFDPGQKAVLTSCVLTRRGRGGGGGGGDEAGSSSNGGENGRSDAKATAAAAAPIHCCFSFTIRRDSFGCPTAIVGNFLPISGGSGGGGNAGDETAVST